MGHFYYSGREEPPSPATCVTYLSLANFTDSCLRFIPDECAVTSFLRTWSMSWVTVVWSMIAAACLTLATVHGVVWWWRREAWASVLFALTAVATTFLAAGECG